MDPLKFAVFQRLPKAELHVHLEGSFSSELALVLAQRDTDHPWHFLSPHALKQRLICAHFPDFLARFIEGYRLLRTRSDYQQLTEALAHRLTSQGVVYAEVLYSPGVAIQKLGVSLHDIHQGMADGLAQFPNLQIRWILDTVLNLGPEFMGRTLEAILADPPSGLIGFCVGGGDPQLEMDAFLPLFDRASNAGLSCIAHVGEVDGPQNIRCLVENTDVARIVHAVSLTQDDSVLDLVKRRGIAIDVCPTSNLCTGVVSSMEQHPLKSFLEKALTVTLNTDDPFYFQTDLFQEYQYLSQFPQGQNRVWDVVTNGWQAAFLPPSKKLEMCRLIDSFRLKGWL